MGTILVVSDNINGFFSNSVCNELETHNILIFRASFDNEKMIQDTLKDCTLILTILSDDFNIHSPFVSSLKKKCMDYNKKIVIYGSTEKITDMKRLFSTSMIAEEYVRPMQNSDMANRLENLVERFEKKDKQKHILVVDDSGPMLRTIMGWLEGTYKVSLANSAVNASIAINKEKPDLILLDYEMPVMSGPQFLKKLRDSEETKYIPVIFLTSQSDTDSVKAVLTLKPQGYILKTTSGENVIAKIEEIFHV